MILRARYAAYIHAGCLGKQNNLRFKIDVVIRDMERKDAGRREVAFIEFNGLSGQKMERYGVAGECVDHQNIEVLRRLLRE
jgi:hypothetical protein